MPRYIWSKMLPSSWDALLKLSKETSQKKMFPFDCITLYINTKCKSNLSKFLFFIKLFATSSVNWCSEEKLRDFRKLRKNLPENPRTWNLKREKNSPKYSIGEKMNIICFMFIIFSYYLFIMMKKKKIKMYRFFQFLLLKKDCLKCIRNKNINKWLDLCHWIVIYHLSMVPPWKMSGYELLDYWYHR